MENIKAEVHGKIRSAIKAKLMELGAYVDEELPDYIMVMVVNKRTKEQMEEDLQLFLGTNTEHFTIWLHQVLQKLEEVTGLDKKALKTSILSEPETSERKRKSSPGSLDSDGHRKEKRRKSHESKKTKKSASELDKGKEQKKNGDAAEVELNVSEEPSSSVKQETDTVVSSSVSDSSVQISEVNSGVVSSSSIVDSEMTAVAKEMEDGVAVETSIISEVATSELSAEDKVVLNHNDEEDDDEDCINIKADAEAEALLNEELPKETAVVSSDRPGAQDTLVLVEKQVPIKIVRKNIVIDSSEPDKLEIPLGTFDRRRKDNGDSNVVPLSERFARKRKLQKDSQVGVTPPIRLVTQALSIKDRLGVKKSDPMENSELSRPAPRVQDRLGKRTVAVEPLKKRKIEPIVMTANARNSSQAIEKAIRDRIYGRVPNENTINQDQKKRPILSRVVLPHPGREEEEYDPANPAVGTVASVVKVKPRPRLPAEMQANKNLLLKAVAEAQKSVAAAPIRPEPLSGSRRNLADSVLARRARAGNIAITLPNRRAQPSVNSQKIDTNSERLVLPASHSRDKITIHVSTDSMQSNSSLKSSLRQMNNLNNIRYKNEELTLDAEQELNHSIEFSVENEDDLLPDEGIVTEIEEEVPVVYPPVGLASRMPRERPQPPRSESPQFLVTLDGLDPNMFSSHNDNVDDELCSSSNVQEDDEDQDDDSSKVSSSPSPTRKEKVNKSVSPIVFTKKEHTSEVDVPKSLERCKFWPSCRLGDKCAFHHPNAACKSFPKCPFRDKCLYIHPMCKFASSCTRKDCPFSHSGLTTLTTPVVAVSASRLKLKSGPSTQVCKYFPKCSNPLCQFLHPKPCRYGKFCGKKPNCNYLHDELPSVDKLKWTSPFRT